MNQTQIDAINALDGMASIIENEMLVHQAYITPEPIDDAKVGQICNGYGMCAVGSLWRGAGEEIGSFPSNPYYARLEGTGPHERDNFIKFNPGLELAYKMMNRVSQDYANKHNIDLDDFAANASGGYAGSMELLFESGLGTRDEGYDEYERASDDERKVLLKLIKKAKRKIVS